MLWTRLGSSIMRCCRTLGFPFAGVGLGWLGLACLGLSWLVLSCDYPCLSSLGLVLALPSFALSIVVACEPARTAAVRSSSAPAPAGAPHTRWWDRVMLCYAGLGRWARCRAGMAGRGGRKRRGGWTDGRGVLSCAKGTYV